ncbi:FtsX-like permease family protein [Amedibacillus sp. YH-ame10]
MKKKALLKDTTREIKKSFGRFISIFAIVGIGVAFYAGIKASVPIMKSSADVYYDDYRLMDFKVQSTLGLTKDDATAIEKISGVEGVYASHTLDTLTMQGSQQNVVRVMSFPMNKESKDSSYINQYKLVEGRMPTNENECIMEADKIAPSGYALGDKITLTSGTSEKLGESLKNDTYTVVGKVMTPYYLSYEKGSSTVGDGKVARYIAIPDTNFTSDVYSEIYVTVDGAVSYNSYHDDYFDKIKPIEKAIKKISKERGDVRLQEVKKTAQDKLDEGIVEYEENKAKFDREIADAKAKLAEGEQQLNKGKADLSSNIKNTETTFKQKEQEIADGRAKVAELQQQYTTGSTQLESNKEQFENSKASALSEKAKLQTQLDGINEQLIALSNALQNPALGEEEKAVLLKQKEELTKGQAELSNGILKIQSELDNGQQQLDNAQQQLTQLKEAISTTTSQLNAGEQQIKDGKLSAQKEFEKAQATISKNEKELNDNKIKLANEERDGIAKLEEAKETIEKGKKDIAEIEEPKWYVLDRHSHYSYMDFGGAADRMDGIAKVFPVFFYLVAALVCLTTMTRMVDEQRQEIGTLKALGYSNAYIAMKYIAYAGIASIFGGLFGALVGTVIFPTVIYNAWGIMYLMPSVTLHFEVAMAFTSIGIASFVTIAAAVFACYKDLMETPSLLMRPKAPKNGKTILLERIHFIWKHFNFIHKVTARNIFRYKKRFLMTVIGISGCTALLVAGFGVQDSIGEIVTKQYGDIFTFDMSVTYKEDSTLTQREELNKQLSSDSTFKDHMEVSILHGTFRDKGDDQGVDIYVVNDKEKFKDFIDVRTRIGHEEVPIQDDGAVITEKLAKRKGVDVGDTLAINNGDGVQKKVKITGICENYVGHAIYMSNTYYKGLYHVSAKPSGQLIKIKKSYIKEESKIGNKYMQDDMIQSVSFYSSIASSFEKTVDSLSFVVVVLIISAGLLAFVVLYNLTNVNISERLREIATIKVLGFYDNEVSAYVYRENIFLTIIGGFVGLFLGIALHGLIMDLAELDNVMFGRNIDMSSFMYSFLITVAFAIIVNLAMFNKLKKVPMVESLKSVE